MQHQQKLGNFIAKLQYLLNRQEYSEIICWDKTKTMIDVISEEKMQTQIIPLYFRHQKYESFVRQLNLYGFKKIKCNGRHRFTHSHLLNGEKLESITTNKSTKIYNKKGKDNPNDTPSDNCIDPEKSLENEVGYNQSRNEFKVEPIKTTQLPHSKPNTDATLNTRTQLLAGYMNPYLNYWNMFRMEQPNQFSGVFFLAPMQAYQ